MSDGKDKSIVDSDDDAANENGVASQYERLHRVGEGTYAVVYQARHRETNALVAIKKIKIGTVCISHDSPPVQVGQFKDGLDMSAIRELKFLQEL